MKIHPDHQYMLQRAFGEFRFLFVLREVCSLGHQAISTFLQDMFLYTSLLLALCRALVPFWTF